jgi:hypothetical protein
MMTVAADLPFHNRTESSSLGSAAHKLYQPHEAAGKCKEPNVCSRVMLLECVVKFIKKNVGVH